MADELEDEVTSINAIYGENTLVKEAGDDRIFGLVFPSQPSISLRVEFPINYPDVPPSILGTQSIGAGLAKGEGTSVLELVRNALAETYNPSVPCIFDLIQEVDSRIQELGLDASARSENAESAKENGQQAPVTGGDGESGSDIHQQLLEDIGEEPPWIISDVITEKKSVFVARAAAVTSVDQAKQYLAHLLVSDKKVAKATHNITAWRVRCENGVQFQDCDDDGETAAGGRLLHLLELMGVWNVMVVVTRWYGGVHLGPDRFRIINQTARDAVVKGGFDQTTSKDDTKKKCKR
jgi:hypothetical protein